MTKTAIALDDKYTQEEGRIYISGNQALVRLPMMQRWRDIAAGMNTAGYITGYRGSPLGVYDSNLWAAAKLLKENHINFQPGVNEELALTAVRGTQWMHYYPQAKYDGIFAIWYAKNLGVDRAFEVMRQGNLEGSAKKGGVLIIGGDDTGGKSTVTATSSDPVWRAALMPVLYPSNTQEYLDYGLLGWALSRFSGTYVGFKTVTDTIERTSTVDLDPSRSLPVIPDFAFPPGGINKIKGDLMPLPIERRLIEYKLPAVKAFVRANGMDKVIFDSDRRELGIMTAGKPYADTREALVELGIDEARARALGIRLYKLAMTHPLEPEGALAFSKRHREVLVIEEKMAFVEEQLVALLYTANADERPDVTGKADTSGRRLVPEFGETSVHLVMEVLIDRIEALGIADEALKERIARIKERKSNVVQIKPTGLIRTAFFCSGCPHNTSTRTVDGSLSFAGVGCHGLAAMLMPDRPTEWSAQMGGEGMLWAGLHQFVDIPHAFQNLGDGTYFHSGLMAIRASVASGANLTYKLLYNDAVAMTGGQPVDGTLTVEAMANQVFWEGVKPIVIVTDEPDKYPSDISWPAGTTIRHRKDLEEVQRDMQTKPGVSAIIYDQTCAAEKRRRRKRGKFPDPDKRLFINQEVCEGCGDCTKKSNCVSVQPVETEFGRKRKIDQSSCNKDFSCQEGFCPSFVSVLGGTPRKFGAAFSDSELADTFAALPAPAMPAGEGTYNILLTGIGGTGVLTVAAIAGMAAHLDNKGASVMDMTGMAQKGGAVLSHIRIAPTADALHAPRLWNQSADLVIGCDMVATTSPGTLEMMAPDTAIVVNTEMVPTAQFQNNNKIDFNPDTQLDVLRSAVGDHVQGIDATEIVAEVMGDTIYTNMFMLGYAVQKGLVPLTLQSIEEAIKLNGIKLRETQQVFNWGRLAAHDPRAIDEFRSRVGISVIEEPISRTVDEIIEKRIDHLTAYQNAAYAQQYSDFIGKVREAETAAGMGGDLKVTREVALSLSKLMSYKDEYEVARLYTRKEYWERLNQQFEGDFKIKVHLAPPILSKPRTPGGEPQKIEFGAWVLTLFKVLTKFKGLRGGPLDIFGYNPERKMERRLIREYREMIEGLLGRLSPSNQAAIAEIAALGEMVKGYGPIKDRNVELYEAEKAKLIAQLDQPVLQAA